MKTAIRIYIIILTAFFFWCFYKVGYQKGSNAGYFEAMDTCISILGEHRYSDTTVSEMVFEGEKDTVTYYLSRKHPLNP